MNNAGIIYEIQKNKVIVLNSDGKFVFIRKKGGMDIGQVIEYFDTDICINKNPILRFAPVASGIAAVLVFAVLFFHTFYNTGTSNIYGFIDVDINPSIEFAFDREYTVLKVIPLNGDAVRIIEGLKLKGEPLYIALDKFIDKSGSLNYIDLKGHNPVLISAALNSESKEHNSNNENALDTLLNDITSKIEEANMKKGADIDLKALKVTPEERKIALKYNISMGKYHLYANAKEQEFSSEIKNLRNKKVSELLKKADIKASEPTPGIKTVISMPQPQNTSKALYTKEPDKKYTTGYPVSTGPKGITPPPLPVISPTVTQKPVQTAQKPVQRINKNIAIQFYGPEKLVKTQGIHVDFRITNTGSDPLDLRNVKIRYYFSREGTSPVKYAKYFFSPGGTGDFHAEILTLPKTPGADHCVEFSFDKGSVLPGKDAYIQGEITQEDWGYFDQSNDYSFNSSDNEYVDWNRMTAYESGVLVWGIEP